jgi:hypothetical protein
VNTTWLPRPAHFRAVHEFHTAAAHGDLAKLQLLLDPNVAVVIAAERVGRPAAWVVRGVEEASRLLSRGLAVRPGLRVDERSVNDQAGLVLHERGRAIAAMTLDFTHGQISSVWIRLQPELLRHGNRVWGAS